jgi:serine/threonine-protein kinase
MELIVSWHVFCTVAGVAESKTVGVLVLGVLAALVAATAAPLWLWSQDASIPAGLHFTLTSIWGIGGAIIGLVAACVIVRWRQRSGDARLGQYTLLEKIGEGGMGAVYRASHALLRRPTAVKLLPAAKAGAERIKRFEREVQVTSQLTHPNTVAIFDYGRTPDGVFYYAMEYLEGLTLEEVVSVDGPQHPGRVVQILRQVAASLAEAHGLSIVHRDIKPSNIILVPERGAEPDVVKVVDFGLVKDLDDDASAITIAGRIAGTPHYLSPEAISSPDRVGPHSDVYALGCVAYFLLTGHRVFEGRTAVEVCGHHLHSLPVLPSERLGRPVPELLSALIMSCLQKDPERRPTAKGLIALIDAGLDVPAWSSDMARTWWSHHDLAAIRAARQQHAAEDRKPAARSGSATRTSSTRTFARA